MIPENYIAVQVPTLWGSAPLVGDKCGEVARVVVRLGRFNGNFPAAAGSVITSVEVCMTWIVAAIVAYHIFVKPLFPFFDIAKA